MTLQTNNTARVTVSGTGDVTLNNGRVLSASTVQPTMTPADVTGFGAGPTVVVDPTSTDFATKVTFTTGAGLANNGTFTLHLTAALGATNPVVLATGENGSGDWGRVVFLVTGFGADTITMSWNRNGGNWAAGLTYKVNILVIGK
jgi:hypothetical protein